MLNINNQRDDLCRLEDGLNELAAGSQFNDMRMDYKILSDLSQIIRKEDFGVTVCTYENTLVSLESGDTSKNFCAIAMDIGTTTIARVLELMIVLSRAAVEGGGNLEMVFGLNFKYLSEVSSLNNVEKLCQWIIKVLDRFSECMYNVENINNVHIIQKSMEYINDNVSDNISLNSVAEYVYLSPSYFSRLFKKEMGINFIDY